MIRARLIGALAIVTCAFQGEAVVREASATVHQAFDVTVRHAPSPIRASGRIRLVYEVMLLNVSRASLALRRIEAFDAATGAPLAALDGPDLAAAIEIVGTGAAPSGAVQIDAGRTALAFLQIDLGPGSPVPTRLNHRIAFGEGERTGAVTGGEVRVADRPLPRIGPPLRGGPWAAVHDPGLTNGHRRYLYATGGRALIPGRHAIDWMAADHRPGDGLGTEVLAVADGVVVAARDLMPEPDPARPRPRVPLADAAGNFIALDIGDGHTAFYEHLAPGHIVRVGDRVVRGQPIGRLGSTGQASRPHLHFHLASGNVPLDAEGLPYALEGARVVGRYPDVMTAAHGGPWTAHAPRPLGAEDDLPPPNSVIRFD